MRRHIAIYHTWPDVKNGEYETILRILHAAKNIKIDVTIIDNDGYVLGTTGEPFDHQHRVTHKDVDFAISLHFESPKLHDIYTYYALWNPVEFYFDWGYEKSVEKILTHDDLLSCLSDFADAHALNLFDAIERRPPMPLPRLNHTISGNVLAPCLSEKSRIFYVGINWERINNRRGRHHHLLAALDEAELVDIYGPETFNGVHPWEGYRGYRGSIPFDGVTTIKKIAEAGICLAFSSAAHQRSAIMSSRLFEGLAAGALVIANKHPFVERYFQGVIDVVDDSLPPDEVVSQVKHIVRWARENPRAATEKAAAAQKNFLEHFTLEQALTNLFDQHQSRVKTRALSKKLRPSVDVIVVFTEQRVSRLAQILDDLKNQSLPPKKVVVVCDEIWWGLHRARIEGSVTDSECSVDFILFDIFSYNGLLTRSISRNAPIGPAIWRALTKTTSDFFAILKPNETLFSDHFESSVKAISKDPETLAVQSGIIIEYCIDQEREQRRLVYNAPKTLEEFFYCNQDRYSGANIYSRNLISLINGLVFHLTDGQEHNYLNAIAFLKNKLTFSNKVTYVYREQDEKHELSPLIPVALQHQFIRDALGKARARMEMIRIPKLPEVIFSHPDATQPFSALIRRPLEPSALIRPGEIYRFVHEGNGAALLGAGWSRLEADGVWMDGRAGTLEFGCACDDGVEFNKMRFTLQLEGRAAHQTGRAQHLTCIVNGVPIAYFEINTWWDQYRFDAPKNLFGDNLAVRLRLVADHAEPPHIDDNGQVVDPRSLGAKIGSLQCDLL